MTDPMRSGGDIDALIARVQSHIHDHYEDTAGVSTRTGHHREVVLALRDLRAQLAAALAAKEEAERALPATRRNLVEEMRRQDARIAALEAERDESRLSYERVAAASVQIATERDAALATISKLETVRAALEEACEPINDILGEDDDTDVPDSAPMVVEWRRRSCRHYALTVGHLRALRRALLEGGT